jgi:hypothetical protein
MAFQKKRKFDLGKVMGTHVLEDRPMYEPHTPYLTKEIHSIL